MSPRKEPAIAPRLPVQISSSFCSPHKEAERRGVDESVVALVTKEHVGDPTPAIHDIVAVAPIIRSNSRATGYNVSFPSPSRSAPRPTSPKGRVTRPGTLSSMLAKRPSKIAFRSISSLTVNASPKSRPPPSPPSSVSLPSPPTKTSIPSPPRRTSLPSPTGVRATTGSFRFMTPSTKSLRYRSSEINPSPQRNRSPPAPSRYHRLGCPTVRFAASSRQYGR